MFIATYYCEWTIQHKGSGRKVTSGEGYIVNTNPNLQWFDSFGHWSGLEMTGAGSILEEELLNLWAKDTTFYGRQNELYEVVFTATSEAFTLEEWFFSVGKTLRCENENGQVVLGLFKYSI